MSGGFTCGEKSTLVGLVTVVLNPLTDRSEIVVRDLTGDEIARLTLPPIAGLHLAQGLVQAGQMSAALMGAETPEVTHGPH